MAFAYLKEITEAAEKENKPFWQIVIEDDMRERNVSYEQSFETMRGMYQAMKEADAAYDPKLIAGFVPKFSALLTTIPQYALGNRG